jgi:hypothetical protein
MSPTPRVVTQWETVKQYVPTVRHIEPLNELYTGGFPTTGWTHNGHGLARIHREAHIVQDHVILASGVRKHNLQHGFASRPQTWRPQVHVTST